METVRKPFQGVGNILRFNWHLYLVSGALLCFLFALAHFLSGLYLWLDYVVQSLVILPILISLVVSFYVYDCSTLYKFGWLSDLEITPKSTIVNINAGFDETSDLLNQRFPNSELKVYDFYDPLKHTEVSIKRARRAYAPYKETFAINTSLLPLPDSYADFIFLMFAAHEIRNGEERTVFFRELTRILKPGGRIILVEHLRNPVNFCAYNIGFLHFLSRASWDHTFRYSLLSIAKETTITPFVTHFTLIKNGVTA